MSRRLDGGESAEAPASPAPVRKTSMASIPLRIAQISDIHCGEPSFDAELMRSIIDRINSMNPDLVAVVGDLTAAGYQWEFEEAAEWLALIEPPPIVIPGHHHSRNVG